MYPGALDHLDLSNGACAHDLADVVTSVDDDTQVLATFTAPPTSGMDGLPALTAHRYGDGTAAYVAGKLGADGIARSLPCLFDALGLPLADDDAAGDVLRVVREHEDGAVFEFLFNRRDHDVAVPDIDGDVIIMSHATRTTLAPTGAIVVRR